MAIETLRAVLQPLDIEPVLEVREIDRVAFVGDTLASNRIWIAGRPMEDWLDASVGSTTCCSVCGDAECRTVKVDGAEFETVPKELVLRAALIAAASLLAAPIAPTTN